MAKSLLERGFKTRSEKKSESIRNEMGLESYSHLCAFELANHLNIKVYKPSEIFGEDVNIDMLVGTKGQNNGWSALTMETKKNNRIIIHNNLHSDSRQQSDLMHELAHVICNHKPPPARTDVNIPIFMREHDPKQEQEAILLGSVLQLPRVGLLWALKKNMSKDEISQYYNASDKMVNFRINSSGVKNQLKYLKR